MNFCLRGLLACGAAICVARAETVLWPHGDFSGAAGARIEKSASGDELVIRKPGEHLSRAFDLKPEWRVIRLKGEMRVTDVPMGSRSWETGRFAMEWRDAKGKTVTPWPLNHGWTGTTGWNAVDHDYLVPAGAKRLHLNLCNLSSGGEVRFRNVSLTVVRNFMDSPANAPLPAGAPADPESLDGAWTARPRGRAIRSTDSGASARRSRTSRPTAFRRRTTAGRGTASRRHGAETRGRSSPRAAFRHTSKTTPTALRRPRRCAPGMPGRSQCRLRRRDGGRS